MNGMTTGSEVDLKPARSESDAPEGEMPSDIEPMKAQLADEPFDRPGWLFELKWDGFRAIAEIRTRESELVLAPPARLCGRISAGR
jgi:ATP-dependent DNA ligase